MEKIRLINESLPDYILKISVYLILPRFFLVLTIPMPSQSNNRLRHWDNIAHADHQNSAA
jgi:hypothetical protein